MASYQELTMTMQKMKRAEERLNHLLQSKRSLSYILKEKKEQLEAEEYDVEKLEGLSLNGFLHLIKGTLLDQLDKEEREAVLARKEVEATQEMLNQCFDKIEEARYLLKDKLEIQRAYEACLKQLEKDLIPMSPGLKKLSEDQAYAKEVLREIREAQEAGETLQGKLSSLYDKVNQIKNKADIDRSGLFKYDEAENALIDEINKILLGIQEDLHRFELELQDVFNVCDLSCDLSFLKTFSNFLIAGLCEEGNAKMKQEEFLKQMTLVLEALKEVMNVLKEQKESIAFFIKKIKTEKQICVQKLLEEKHEEGN